MSAVPTAKPKKARRTREQQILDLQRKDMRETTRARARQHLDYVRERMIERDHAAAHLASLTLTESLERCAQLDDEIASEAEQKAAQ